MAQRREILALAALGMAAFAAPAYAQATKPIRFIVPYPPGGPLDIVARALADKVKDTLGVVVVENRPGAGGNLGADLAAKAAPDGTTIVMGAVATHAINPWLFAKMPYDAIRDFTPITGVAQVTNVLVMNPQTRAPERVPQWWDWRFVHGFSPELKARLATLLAEPIGGSPDQFGVRLGTARRRTAFHSPR